METLRVLVLCMEYGPAISGGVGTYVFELVQGLARAGHEVTVVSSSLDESRVERQGRLTIHFLSLATRHLQAAPGSMVDGILAWNEILLAYVRRLFAAGEPLPDVVHCTNWISFHASREIAREIGLPLLASIHYVSEPVERWWGQEPDPGMVEQERRVCAEADLLLTVSHSMSDLLQGSYGVPADKIRVVHNGLDPAAFLSSGAKGDRLAGLRASLLDTGAKLVLFAGRLNPMKGITALIEAAAQVVAAHPAVRYAVAGGADSRSYSERIRESLAGHPILDGKLRLLGKVPRNQLALLYQTADLAVVPSVYEPFGYASLEAMAAGLPVVGTDVGGISEVVLHGETGLLAPVVPDARNGNGLRRVDVDALAQAQLTLLMEEDAATARRMGEAGQRRLSERFTQENMLAGTIAAMRDCIARFRG